MRLGPANCDVCGRQVLTRSRRRNPIPGLLAVLAFGWSAHAVEPDTPVPPAEGMQADTERSVIVEGQVTDPVGAGQEGVTVTVRRPGNQGREGALIAEATTDTFGDFVVTTTEPLQGDVVVVFTKPHYADLVREVRIKPDELPPFLAVGLEGKLELVGNVKDSLTGRALAGIRITCKSYGQDHYGLTDQAGRFTIAGLSPGPGEVIVEADGFGREQQRIERIQAGGRITIDLKPERIVHIKTVDDLKNPIGGVTVELYDQPRDDFRTAVTGPRGVATIRGLHFDAQSLRLRLTHDDHVSSQAFDRAIELTPEKTESTHELTMPRAGVIAGKVTDAITGKAIYAARVVTGDEWSDRSPRDWTSEVGQFMIHGVPPGPTTVTVHVAGYAPELEMLDVKAGATAKLTFKLHSTVALKGIVKEKDGHPIAGAQVEATRWRDRGTLGLRAVSGSDGTFLIRDIPRDEFEITVMARNYDPVKQTVKGGSAGLLEIILPKNADADGPGTVGPNVGDPAPPLTLTTLDGKTINLADLRGKTVVLSFWATWCPPCIEELQDLAKVYERFGTRNDFVMIGLSRDFEEAAVREFLKKNKKLAWHQVFGQEGGVETACQKLGVSWIPRLIIIGPDGRVLVNHFTPDDDIQRRIEQILKENERT